MSGSDHDAENWQPSVFAFECLAASVGIDKAGQALVDRLATGVIRAKAGKLIATLYNRFDANRTPLRHTNKDHVLLEKQFFKDMMIGSETTEPGKANLDAGLFEALRPDTAHDNLTWASGPYGLFWEVRATGVVICMSDVVVAFPATKAKAQLSPPSKTPTFEGSVRDWIAKMVADKKPKQWIEQNYHLAIPISPLSRKQVREIYDEIKQPRMGRPVNQ